MCAQLTVHCSFTSQSVWQRWVECCGVSGHVICISGFCATTVVGGRRDSESVTTAERDNEAASKDVTYRLTVQCLVWLLRPVDSLIQRSCDGRGGASDHGGSDASSPPCCCQSLHLTLSTTDAFFTHAARLAALHVRLLSEIHSTQAWLFISLVLHGKWDLDPRTVHIRKN